MKIQKISLMLMLALHCTTRAVPAEDLEALEAQIAALKGDLSEARIDLRERTTELQELKSKADEYKDKIDKQDEELKDLKNKLDEKNTELEKATRKSTELEQKLSSLEQASSARETTIPQAPDLHLPVLAEPSSGIPEAPSMDSVSEETTIPEAPSLIPEAPSMDEEVLPAVPVKPAPVVEKAKRRPTDRAASVVTPASTVDLSKVGPENLTMEQVKQEIVRLEAKKKNKTLELLEDVRLKGLKKRLGAETQEPSQKSSAVSAGTTSAADLSKVSPDNLTMEQVKQEIARLEAKKKNKTIELLEEVRLKGLRKRLEPTAQDVKPTAKPATKPAEPVLTEKQKLERDIAILKNKQKEGTITVPEIQTLRAFERRLSLMDEESEFED